MLQGCLEPAHLSGTPKALPFPPVPLAPEDKPVAELPNALSVCSYNRETDPGTPPPCPTDASDTLAASALGVTASSPQVHEKGPLPRVTGCIPSPRKPPRTHSLAPNTARRSLLRRRGTRPQPTAVNRNRKAPAPCLRSPFIRPEPTCVWSTHVSAYHAQPACPWSETAEPSGTARAGHSPLLPDPLPQWSPQPSQTAHSELSSCRGSL